MTARQQRLVFAPLGTVDLGQVGQGGSGSHYLSINGRQHIGKCRSRANGAWVCFNEFFAARLATRLDLPIPPFQVVQFQGSLATSEQWFCSERITPGANPVPATYGRLVNAEKLAGIAVFDIWLCNTDRSPTNLFAQQVGTNQERLFIIDHGHTLLTSGTLPALAAQDVANFLRCNDLIDAITNVNSLGQAIEAAAAVPELEVIELIQNVPDAWIPDVGALDPLRDFILTRRDRLRSIIEANLQRFPKVHGGP